MKRIIEEKPAEEPAISCKRVSVAGKIIRGSAGAHG